MPASHLTINPEFCVWQRVSSSSSSSSSPPSSSLSSWSLTRFIVVVVMCGYARTHLDRNCVFPCISGVSSRLCRSNRTTGLNLLVADSSQSARNDLVAYYLSGMGTLNHYVHSGNCFTSDFNACCASSISRSSEEELLLLLLKGDGRTLLPRANNDASRFSR